MNLAVNPVSGQLIEHVRNSLAGSRFFTAFHNGNLSLAELRDIFGQYYLWRNQFHRWFGVCIVRSPSFGMGFPTDFVLGELTEHIEVEITGDHHGMCAKFLKSIGVGDPSQIRPTQITADYNMSFPQRYLSPQSTFEEGLAALAGREIVAPARNRLTIDAFARHYGVHDASNFFSLHEELEVEHFEGLWGALRKSGPNDDAGPLIAAAKREISAHVAFWDDVYAYYGRKKVAATLEMQR